MYLKLIFLILFASCSFNSETDNKKNKSKIETLSSEQLELLDSDGDLINDKVEIENGLDRFIANYPKLKVNFLQDYSIEAFFHDGSKYFIDTKVGRDNPAFKYSVGDLLARDLVRNKAASAGRFSNVSWANFKNNDYTMIKYPRIDQSFFHNSVHNFKKYKVQELEQVNIQVDNSIKLTENKLYTSIENLEIGFYYYSYSKEKLVEVHSETLKRTFLVGSRENFTINISKIPKELLLDNYLRKGEFLISKIKDFEIPELKIKYTQLMKSIKAKAMPVYTMTPFGTTLNYVSIASKGNRFTDILSKVFSDKFEIKNNRLIRINEFQNNLRDYKYLNELRALDKEGKWFVLTNKLKKHYLNHDFNIGDSLVLSYFTGRELASNIDESVFQSTDGFSSGKNTKVLEIGNVSKNSKLNINFYPIDNFGFNFHSKKIIEYGPRAPSCRGNCSGRNSNLVAHLTIRTFREFKKELFLEHWDDLFKNIELKINNTTLDIEELVSKNLLFVDVHTDSNKNYVSVRIEGVSKMEGLRTDGTNIFSIKAKVTSVESLHEGIRLDRCDNASFRDWQMNCNNYWMWNAERLKLPYALDSWKFDEITNYKGWTWRTPSGYRIQKSTLKRAFSGVSFDIVSTITNYLN